MKKVLILIFILCFLPIASYGQVITGQFAGALAAGSDTNPPTLSSSTIATNGTTWTEVFSETVSVGSGGNGGWSGSCTTAGAITLAYSSGSGSSSLVYTGSPTVNSGDTCTISYTQPGNGIEDLSGNDLATIASASVTNNSTQGISCTNARDTCSGTSGRDGAIGQYSSNIYLATQFTAAATKTICKAVIKGLRVGSSSSVNVRAEIWSDNGGSPGAPSSILGYSDNVAWSSFPTTEGDVTFNNLSVALTATTKYHLVLHWQGAADSSNYVNWRGLFGCTVKDITKGTSVPAWTNDTTSASCLFALYSSD